MHFQEPGSGIQLCYRQVGCRVNQRQRIRATTKSYFFCGLIGVATLI